MNNKLESRNQQRENIRKIFQDIHEGLRSDHLTASLEKKLSPFKKLIQKTTPHKSPSKISSQVLKRKNHANELLGSCYQQKNQCVNEQQNQEFLELYNNDPIFKCRIERLLKQEKTKLRKNSLKSPKSSGCEVDGLDDQGTSGRITLKSHVSEKDRALLSKISNYKKILKRTNSNETSPSSEDNE